MNVKLLIKSNDDQKLLDQKIFWKVYILETNEHFQNNQKVLDKLHSPVNISMNSNQTELLFNFQFKDVRKLLLECLKYNAF